MGYSYLVLGAGVGKAIAWWLARQDDTEKVVIADTQSSRAACAAIIAGPSGKRDLCVPLVMNVLNEEKLGQALRGMNVFISALPARLNPRLAEIAVRARTHFCDLGGVVSITGEMLGLDALARDRGVCVVPDCGLMPGLGNVILRHFMEKMKTLAPMSARIAVGGLPERPEPPSNYQRIYSVPGLEHMCYDPAPVIRNGRVCEIDPLSENIGLCIPELTEICPQFPFIEAFPSSGASLAPWQLVNEGVRDFQELTLRWPGFIDFVRRIPRSQFGEAMAELPGTDAEHPDVIFMEVSLAEMERPNRILSCRLLDRYDHENGLSALERTTGFSAAALARMMARGAVAPGVRTAEYALGTSDRQLYLDHLFQLLRFTWHEA